MSEPSASTKVSRRVATASLAACVAVSLSAFVWAPAGRAESHPASQQAARAGLAAPDDRIDLAFTAHFDGVGAEGIDNFIWSGKLLGAEGGAVVLRVAQLGAPADRTRAVWPVRALVTVATDDPLGSFAANMDGTVDWAAGSMRLTGTISDGWMKGTPVHQLVTLDRVEFDGAGTLAIELTPATR
jgi:hypothetical protein